MKKFLVAFSNSIYFIALTSIVFVSYLFVFAFIFSVIMQLTYLGLEIPTETMETILPILFFGGLMLTILFFIKHKINTNEFIQHDQLTKKLVSPFIFIAIGSVGLFANIYLIVTMKTGAASGLFFLLPGIWMVGFFSIGCIQINNYIYMNRYNNSKETNQKP